MPHEPKPIKIYPKEFYPSIEIEKEEEQNKLLNAVLTAKNKDGVSESDLFRVMATRRSTRNFDVSKAIEQWKIEKILAAADTAPTAGNFQGFKLFYIKNKEIKKRLVEAANNQPYVNAPLVLVFCIDPSRVKTEFSSRNSYKVFTTRCNISSSLFTVSCIGTGFEFNMDWDVR